MSTGFDQVAVSTPRYSRFDLSHDVKLSLRMGTMVPTMCVECLPGDKWNFSHEAMFRLMPLIAPIMHKVDVSFHSFFVPNRIMWSNWEKFIFPEGANSLVPAHPSIKIFGNAASDLANYLGVPVLDPAVNTVGVDVNAFPFAAYQRVWADWFRSQDLDPLADPSLLDLIDGSQDTNRSNFLTTIRTRGWEHDYFTSCLPNAQKGQPVGLPIDLGELPVQWKLQPQGVGTRWIDNSGVPINAADNFNFLGIEPTNDFTRTSDNTGSTRAPNVSYDPNGSLYTDATGFTVNTTINDLRSSWALQQWLEKNMRSGTRYREALESNFGVKSSDARLDRSEYIGGAKGTLAISEVLQTQSSDATTPQGNMAGHAIGVMGSNGMFYRCEEHGFIITICTIIPKTSYYQGLPKMFSRFDRFDYAFPDFAQLGEQTVKNKEIFLNPMDGLDDEDFGYIPRFAEYRNLPSRVCGEMSLSLDFWHMGRKFATRPALNADFIKCVPTQDIFAVEDDGLDNIVAHVIMNISAVRPLPVYGIPAPLV